jgi:glyoxylase-like metal-dependent hydrolase (beta-lactamase superfamily II)
VWAAHAAGLPWARERRERRVRGYVNRRFPSWFDPAPIELERSPVGPFAESLPVTRDGRVRIVPTPGHTRGHASVIVEGDHETLFLAGDASYSEALMHAGIAGGVASDPRSARASLAAARTFCLDTGAIYLPSHDPASGRRLRDRLRTSELAVPAGSGLADEQPWRARPARLGTPVFDRKT